MNEVDNIIEREKTHLTNEQRERIQRNKEAAIARKMSKFQAASADSGWLTVSKVLPFGNEFRKRTKEFEHLDVQEISGVQYHARPQKRQETEKTDIRLPVEPYYLGDGKFSQTYSAVNNVTLNKGELKPSQEQMKVLKAVAMSDNVFLTGSAGTGKSFVLHFAVRQLRSMYGSDAVFVTASTGLAAVSIGGTTIHSFAGIGLGIDEKEKLLDKISSRRDSRTRWQVAKALVIDEISMVDSDLFEKLDFIARKIRKKDRPFGGIQLLVTGDFFQLPPVCKGSQTKKFAFEASCWTACFQLQIELTEVFRQSDSSFVKLLNEVRKGNCNSATVNRLNQCKADKRDDNGVILTRLYPHKVDVGRENQQNLNSIRETELKFTALDSGKSEFAKAQLDNSRAEKELSLRKGAQVMLIKNLDPTVGLANGARGVVVGFCDPRDSGAAEFRRFVPDISQSGMWPVVRFVVDQSERIIGPDAWAIEEGGVEIARRTQVPLILAWALSVHKCQGMTLDRVETDLSRAFDYGMVYVALSRVRSLEGLNLLGFDASKIKVHPKVEEFYEQFREGKE